MAVKSIKWCQDACLKTLAVSVAIVRCKWIILTLGLWMSQIPLCPACRYGEIRHDTSCYRISTIPLLYYEAKKACEKDGYIMASLDLPSHILSAVEQTHDVLNFTFWGRRPGPSPSQGGIPGNSVPQDPCQASLLSRDGTVKTEVPCNSSSEHRFVCESDIGTNQRQLTIGTVSMTYNDAKKTCEANKQRLACLETSQQLQEVQSLLNDDQNGRIMGENRTNSTNYECQSTLLGLDQAWGISSCDYTARHQYVCKRNATDLKVGNKGKKVNSNVGPEMGECASCMKGFQKQQPDGLCRKASIPDCVNAVRGKECPSGQDDTFQVQWDETSGNCFTKRVPCPTGTRGKMRRYCGTDGKWGDVDTTNCVSDELSTKLEMAATAQSISDVGEALSSFRERFSSDADIYGGDLNLTISLLDVIIKEDPLKHIKTKGEKEKYILDMIELISALLDEKIAPHWIRIRNASGQSIGSPEVLEHLEDFSDSVQTFYSKIGHGTFIRTKNLIYQVLLVSDVTWDLKVPSRSNNSASRERRDTSSAKPTDSAPRKMNSFVILPDELLRELNATIVITYLYENPEDVLPQEPVEPPPREWVKTITATKTFTKLNSQVVSVIVYNDTDTLEISKDVEMTMYHHEVGYNSLCYFIEFEHEEGILMSTGCGAVKVDLVGGYTICKCKILGSFVIKSIMGPKPVPFLEAGKKYALIIASIIAAILILISFILICMSRIDIDRYVVMAQATLAYLFFPVCVVIGLFLNDTQGCRVLSLFVYVEAMSSNAWMLCQILQVFFKVKYYVCVSNRRLLYSILGWVFPIVVATFAYVTASETQGSENLTDLYSCFLEENDAVVSESIFLLFSLINLSLLIVTHRMYCQREEEFVWFEKDRLWSDLLIVSLLFPTMIMTWVFGKMTTMNDYFLYTYIFATSLFAFASLIFLGFCATNQELLEAIRVKYFEDQLHREALKEEKLIEIERYKIRNENMKIMRSITEDKVRRRHISKNKNMAIEGIFQTAVHRNRVGVASVSDDIKIEEIK